MKRRQFDVYRMLVRVRELGLAEKAQFPETSLAGQLLDQVGESITQVEEFDSTRINSLRRTAKAKAAAKAALWERLSAMSQTARSIEAVEPTFRNKFQLPKRTSADAVLSAGRAFLESAQPLAATFAAHALQVPEFEAALEAFDRAVRDRDTGKAANANARVQIDAALDAGLKAVRRLDAIVRNHIKDEALVATWEHERRMPDRKGDADEPAATTTPQPIATKAA